MQCKHKNIGIYLFNRRENSCYSVVCKDCGIYFLGGECAKEALYNYYHYQYSKDIHKTDLKDLLIQKDYMVEIEYLSKFNGEF